MFESQAGTNFQKRPMFHHKCAPYTELPSNISTMIYPGARVQLQDQFVSIWWAGEWTVLPSWYLYKMVIQKMLRTYDENVTFRSRSNQMPWADQITDIAPSIAPSCAFFYELQSNIFERKNGSRSWSDYLEKFDPDSNTWKIRSRTYFLLSYLWIKDICSILRCYI